MGNSSVAARSSVAIVPRAGPHSGVSLAHASDKLAAMPSQPEKTQAEKKRAFVAKTLRSGRVALDDISVESDSSWRDIDESRVLELVEMIKECCVHL